MTDYIFQTKVCPICNQEKSKVLHFVGNAQYCKECRRMRAREYRNKTSGKTQHDRWNTHYFGSGRDIPR